MKRKSGNSHGAKKSRGQGCVKGRREDDADGDGGVGYADTPFWGEADSDSTQTPASACHPRIDLVHNPYAN